MKIFISWSKEPSRTIALELRTFLQMVLHADVWVSDTDIAKGKRWSTAIAAELDATNVGIICCTPNNLFEPWLHFEAGALSKSVENAAVHPLCFGVSFGDLPGTMGQFQATAFDKDDVWRLVQSINDAGGQPVKHTDLQTWFNKSWPQLARDVSDALKTAVVPSDAQRADAKPSTEPQDTKLELGEVEISILKWMATHGQDVTLSAVTNGLGINDVRAKHFMGRLVENEYVHAMYNMIEPTKYSLDDKGLELAIHEGWA